MIGSCSLRWFETRFMTTRGVVTLAVRRFPDRICGESWCSRFAVSLPDVCAQSLGVLRRICVHSSPIVKSCTYLSWVMRIAIRAMFGQTEIREGVFSRHAVMIRKCCGVVVGPLTVRWCVLLPLSSAAVLSSFLCSGTKNRISVVVSEHLLRRGLRIAVGHYRRSLHHRQSPRFSDRCHQARYHTRQRSWESHPKRRQQWAVQARKQAWRVP